MIKFLFKLWKLNRPYKGRFLLGVFFGILNGLGQPIVLGTAAFVFCVMFTSNHPEDLKRLADAVPEEDRGPNYWQELACWAFAHDEPALLEDAYSFFTTSRGADMADFMFCRLRLMHHMLAGEATPATVLEAIGRVELRVQLEDFQRMLLPAIEERGLLTPLVQAALNTKHAELKA